jgi:hypothetical protein
MMVSGCALHSGVVPIGKDTFMVSRQAATGFSGTGTLKADAFQEANNFCLSQGKNIQVVTTNESQPPYIMTNFPRAEITFLCLDENDQDLKRVRMERSPDVIIKRDDTLDIDADIHIKEESSGGSDLYTELMKLEDLRQKNILTDEEFQTQKKLLLKG